MRGARHDLTAGTQDWAMEVAAVLAVVKAALLEVMGELVGVTACSP